MSNLFNIDTCNIENISHKDLIYNQLYSWVDQDNDGHVALNFCSRLSNNYFESIIVFPLDRWIKWISFIKRLIYDNSYVNTCFNSDTFCNPIEYVISDNGFTGEVIMLFWDTTTNDTLTFLSVDRFRYFCKFICSFNYIDY